MALKKAGHNLPSEDSEKKPTHEVTPVTDNGPEGYSEYGPIAKSKSDSIKSTNAQSTSPASTSTAMIHENHDDGTELSESTTSSTSDLSTVISEPRGVKLSPYGSPFAYASSQNRHDFFKGLLPVSTCILFDQVVAEAPELRKRLYENPGFATTGGGGLFCALKKGKTSGTKLQLYCFGPDRLVLSLPVGDSAVIVESSSPSTIVNSKAKGNTGIRKTHGYEHFLMNCEFDHVYINNTHVDRNTTAGPLPDFAVLEFGDLSYFWWRTATALDYTPSLKRKRASEDDSASSAGKSSKSDSDASPNSSVSHSSTPNLQDSFSPTSSPPVSDFQVFPDSKDWLDEYRRRVEICENRPVRYTSSITDVHPPHQYPCGELHYEDVVLAIGAVWLGLKSVNADFAYANSNTFSIVRSERMVGMHAVNGPNHFVIPLLFSEELQALPPEPVEDTAKPLEPAFSAFQQGEKMANQENSAAFEKTKQTDPSNTNKHPPSLQEQESLNKEHKGGIGHFMLAIAEKVNRDGPNNVKEIIARKALVRLRFMDSLEGELDRGLIRRAARNIVRNSGWLGDIWPCFEENEEVWMKVLKQSGNRCGEHTVLNAWAYMLEIPLATNRKRAFGPSFYVEVNKMIHLALRGQLDSLTIRAWMQHSQYAADEPLSQLQQAELHNPASLSNLRNMQTVALNEDAFNEIVNDIYEHEQAFNQSNADKWGAIPVVPGGAMTKQTELATETGVTAAPSSQAPVPGPSSTYSNSAGPVGPVKKALPAQPYLVPTIKWVESLRRGLWGNRDLKERNLRTTQDEFKDPYQIRNLSNMGIDDVVLGIAPVWECLKRLGRPDVDFTYAGLDIFCPVSERELEHLGAVGRWSRFIMPLYFPPEPLKILVDKGMQKMGNSIGHLLLCVAELVNDQPMTVRLEVLDSRPGLIPVEDIRSRAQHIILTSGWLGQNRSTTPMPCTITPFAKLVPRQVGGNTCGLHVILNAWAVMLGIPIHPRLRRGRKESDGFDDADRAFLNQGFDLVNLALEGYMNSATIQAFFNVHGYCVEQRFGDPARAVIPVNAVGMNQEKFFRTLKKRGLEQTFAAARANKRRFPDVDMAFLMDLNLTHEQAWKALVKARGNLANAMQWHFGTSDEPGELPRPEDALSPKTPDRSKKS